MINVFSLLNLAASVHCMVQLGSNAANKTFITNPSK